MNEREDRKWYLLYPEDVWKQRWESYMTLLLVFTCTTTPLIIAFHQEPEDGSYDSWMVINMVVDSFFAIDIIVVFFSAFYDEDFYIIDDMKDIARFYLLGWFTLDVLAITPFDKLGSTDTDNSSGNVSNMVRIAKLGRMQKLIKLTRLLRIIKVVKNKNSMLQ